MGILSTILISGVGAAIANYFTNKTWNHQTQVNKKKTELGNANELFESLSTDMDERLFHMGWVFPGVKSGSVPEKKDVEEWWETYQNILVEWNGKLNRRIAKVERYFGKKMSDTFDLKIQEQFCDLGDMLNEYYYKEEQRKNFKRDPFKEKANSLYELIRKFNLDMIRSIQKGEVGIFHPDVD